MKKYLDKIIENNHEGDMVLLGNMFSDIMHELKDYAPKSVYDSYKIKLKGMAYNYTLDEELAKHIVEDMKPIGEQWNMETLSQLLNNDAHNLCDMYVVINSLANDYKDIIPLTQRDTYIKMAHAWIDDIDGRDHKVWWYFVK